MAASALPNPLTGFVGRAVEISQVQSLLECNRLITLTGVGGVGKTRLGLEVARAWAATDVRAVALVELESVTEARLIRSQLAAALGIHEQPHRPLLDSVADNLRLRGEVLLVLDNCEHMVAACAEIADGLLRRCGELRIVATSREPLGITGEVIWRVDPLSLPVVAPTDPRALQTESEAARLFVARAQAMDRTFEVEARNVTAIVEVCRRLDGIPLALELAAARVAVGIQPLARMLEDRFRLLTAGSRTAPARHQTLRAALDWSYELLIESERLLFERLAVFAGGCTLEAAQTVCTGNGLNAEDVLDVLGQLAAKSLKVVDTDASGVPRYRFLETVRQYAADRLQAHPDWQKMHARHATYFLRFAQQLSPHAFDDDPALLALEREHANLRVALRWLIANEQTEDAQCLGAALGRLWFFRGYLTEGRAWLTELLAMPACREALAARAELLYRAGMLAWVQGDVSMARRPLEEALLVSRKLNEPRTQAQALLAIGHLARAAGDQVAANGWYRQAVEVAKAADLPRHEMIALLGLGWVAYDAGDSGAAREALGEVLARSLDKGWTTLALQALIILGDLRRQAGDHATARSHTERALAMSRAVGARWWVASASAALAQALAWQGEPARAEELARDAVLKAYELGDRPGLARALEVLVHIATESGQPDRALRLAAGAAQLRASTGPPLPPADRDHLAACVRRARRMLATSESDLIWSEGSAVSLDDLEAYALQSVEDRPPLRKNLRAPSQLTGREREVATLIARGLSNRAIAEELVITESTVMRHVSNILDKLNAHSRSEIAVWVVREGLVPGRST